MKMQVYGSRRIVMLVKHNAHGAAMRNQINFGVGGCFAHRRHVMAVNKAHPPNSISGKFDGFVMEMSKKNSQV